MSVRSIKRNIAKNKYAYLKDKEKMNLVFQKAEVFRNGITAENLKKEFQRGFSAGWTDGRERLYKEVFAAVCLVMQDTHSMEEIADFLYAVDARTQISIDADEDLDEVLEKVGINLSFKDDTERVLGV